MTRYQLAKLISWAGTLHSRKKMQKVVFMLQAAGCPFDADYYLHHYGPYSEDVAHLTDEMVRKELLAEEEESAPSGTQYSYRLQESTKKEMLELEKTMEGKRLAKLLAPFEDKAKELLNTDFWLLEVASTIAFFRQQGNTWAISVEKAGQFKSLTANSAFLSKAEGLAQKYVA